MIGTILAMLIMRNYSITEERATEIRAELEKRKNTQITNN
jgi:GPH family glycoside/pentoside/hexuronide:cation symporter